jgi:hypothetical protein
MRALFTLALLLSLQSAHAQLGVPWRHPPTIVILGPAGDPRIALVEEAIAYWNGVLHEVGSAFRLPSPTRVDAPVPEAALQEMSKAIISGQRPTPIPRPLRGLPGDMTILLGSSSFVSFAGRFDPDGKRVIGIRGMDTGPFVLPNVPRNVIAHEIGHGIGLGHNADPTKLMCGRPAPCRPPEFKSSRPHIFPVTEGERDALLHMYPAAPKQ